MIRDTRKLAEMIELLLIQSGFPMDHYYIFFKKDKIIVWFDKKEAVDYFKGDFIYSEFNEYCHFSYEFQLNKHAAVIQII